MESRTLIEFKWENGVYDLKDLLKLVENKEINEKEFFEITRIDYAAAVQKIKNPD